MAGYDRKMNIYQSYGRIIFMLAWLLLIWCSSSYVVSWQPEMSARIPVYRSLKEQGAEEWFFPLLKDARCFPVKKPSKGTGGIPGKPTASGADWVHLFRKEEQAGGDTYWYYEDGYGDGRSYGGARKHEGIDIMSADGKSGVLEVQSVSEGVVEQIGWLELGGYRVGVRSSSGLYFYYAHMDHYASGLKKGDAVHPGTLLGYMGDTGYGKEGTRGKFAVHLHFGVYYDRDGDERSLDPYFLLRILDK